jgi:acetyl-CoA carboxylase biotin carboxyl carrier protein
MREVIQVERAESAGEAPGNLGELARVADELLPPLVARLGVSELGEIEVRQGTWRVRIRRAPGDAARAPQPAAAAPVATSAAGPAAAATAAQPAAAATPTDQTVARSTAVGYFALKSGVAVGHRVSRGDVLGWVDVLGVRKEIVAPSDGVVGRLVTEPGDPVEYGQELIALVAASGVV